MSKLSNYLTSGTHAARPATPTLGTNEISFYYETDTLNTFVYVTGTGWVQVNPGPPAIVQQKAATGSGSVTLASAPIAGNLLIGLTSDGGTSENPGTGWTKLAFNVASQDGAGIYWKLAGGSESTTQTPTTATPGGICVFEINNGSPGAFTQNVDLSGTAIAASTVSTKLTSSLIVGMACNRSASVAPSSITGATLLGTLAQGSSRTVQMFKVTAPANGTNTVTANYSPSQGAIIPMIEIG